MPPRVTPNSVPDWFEPRSIGNQVVGEADQDEQADQAQGHAQSR